MKKILIAGAVIVGGISWNMYYSKQDLESGVPQHTAVTIVLQEDAIMTPLTGTGATVETFLAQTPFALGERDRTVPPRTASLVAGMAVAVMRNKDVRIVVDGESRNVQTYAKTVRDLLKQEHITFSDRDIVTPSLMQVIHSGMRVTVEHVTTQEEVREITIPFRIQERSDDSVSFGIRRTVVKGRNGRARITESVTLKGGKEVARTEIDRTVIVPPTDEVIAVGTKLKLGKKHTGQASWYAYKGCDCAANPWLPKGSFVKVTNRANGKSVVVRINDRGPFVPGRIIDLDIVAFKKIASKGAGVIDVIMEEVKQ